MIRLAELSIRRPKAALACWAVFAAIFIASASVSPTGCRPR